jgi:hypothetical protein
MPRRSPSPRSRGNPLVPGDRIRVTTLRGTYEYLVDFIETVDPEDTQVMESRDRNELTLITCYPLLFRRKCAKEVHRAHPFLGCAIANRRTRQAGATILQKESNATPE